MGVTTIALIDTDSDPDPVDLPIPGNDDSIRSIEVIIAKLADAVLEGKAALPPDAQARSGGQQSPPRQQSPAAPRPPQPAPDAAPAPTVEANPPAA